MMSGPNLSDLSQSTGLQVWGQCWVLSQAATEAKNSSWVCNALHLILSALLEKAIDNSVKDYHKQLQVCVSANGGLNI